jgi:homoaconitase/3-isopropylmalate dehydratase large subunit
MIEEGFVTPGSIIIGADSHSNTYGVMGAFGTGLGSTEIGVAWVTGKCWFKVPETIRVELHGRTQPGVYAKDVMIHLVGLLGMDGGTYRSVVMVSIMTHARTNHFPQYVDGDRREVRIDCRGSGHVRLSRK